MNSLKSRRAFTLIELMIVIAIIAILAAILVPNFIKARAQAQLTGCEENLKNIATACEMYNNDNSNYPAAGFLPLLAPNYLKIIPLCPATGFNTYSGSGYDSVKTFYTLCCFGTNHLAGGIPLPNYPQYSSYSGLQIH